MTERYRTFAAKDGTWEIWDMRHRGHNARIEAYACHTGIDTKEDAEFAAATMNRLQEEEWFRELFGEETTEEEARLEYQAEMIEMYRDAAEQNNTEEK